MILCIRERALLPDDIFVGRYRSDKDPAKGEAEKDGCWAESAEGANRDAGPLMTFGSPEI